MTKVAIITRTKDRLIFLKRAMKSVSTQTYTNYVHLIYCDGGSDDDVDRIKRIVKTVGDDYSKRVKILKGEQSKGPDTIFNKLIDSTVSDYVVIHDDDDTWHCDFLKYTVKRLDDNNEIGGVVAKTDKVYEKVNNNGTITILKREAYMPDVKVVNLYRQCMDNQMTPIAFLYRRNVYEEVGKYDSTLPICGDWEFGVRFLLKYDVDFLDSGFALANYHHRKQALTTGTGSTFKTYDHRIYINKIINKYLRQELKDGKMGVGYIMNDLRYQQHNTAEMFKKAMPSFLFKAIKHKVQN